MKFKERLRVCYMLYPYFGSKKIDLAFVVSLLTSNTCKINLDSVSYTLELNDYQTILQLLSLKRYAISFVVDNDKVIFSFDRLNHFYISLGQLTKIDRILISLLVQGLQEGAIFLDKDHNIPIKIDKSITIIQDSEPKMITAEGIQFLLDTVNPGMIESYVRRMHDHYSQNLDGKVVVDIGASMGDTPLYFASKGATVYAIEMVKSNYDDMLKNLEINPILASRIKPIHAAIGKDGIIEYYSDALERIGNKGGSSFLINKYGENGKKESVRGLTISSLVKEFDIKSIELLKLDCKGCEFFLKKEDLKNVQRVKIEYYAVMKEHKLDSIIDILKESGYDFILFKHIPTDTTSLLKYGNILAEKS